MSAMQTISYNQLMNSHNCVTLELCQVKHTCSLYRQKCTGQNFEWIGVKHLKMHLYGFIDANDLEWL